MLGEELADVLRELAGAIDLGGARRDPLVGQDADRVAEQRLLLGQAVRGYAGSVTRRHRSSGGRSSAVMPKRRAPTVPRP